MLQLLKHVYAQFFAHIDALKVDFVVDVVNLQE